ncbi:MAG: pyridoxal-phosphate dependent enzyme [Pseudomonadota bacterium]
MTTPPTVAEIEATRARIAPYVLETPLLPYYGSELPRRLPDGTELFLKLELFQRTGSFKPRGAVNVMLSMTDDERSRGVVAASAGNHAMATAYAANVLGISAKVAMPKSANPFRVERCRGFGAEIVFAETVAELFDLVDSIQRDEGRSMVHPFEGPRTFEGTATVGWEIYRDAPDLDAVIVPIGGGGLIAGIASAIKQLSPNCQVFGVEPTGANGMTMSLADGAPAETVEVTTIADSLGAPHHRSGSFALVQRFVDDVVTIEDQEMIDAMALMFGDLKLAVEPAGAAAVAALVGPLQDRLAGKRVGIVVCGTNIDAVTHGALLAKASN